jgi:long-chain acyl-CoA synthetase
MSPEAALSSIFNVQTASGIADLLAVRARVNGKKEALVSDGERLSYEQLASRAKTIAKQLKSAGLKRQDKVALYMPNHPNFVASFFAVVGLGAIVVPINPLLKADEISHILTDSQASMLIAHVSTLDQVLAASSSVSTLKNIFVAMDTGETLTRFSNRASVQELDMTMYADSLAWPEPVKPGADLACLVYTSGTTGKPKGAMLTHYNLLSVFPARLDIFEITPDDRCLGMLPLCHIYGMTVVMMGTVAKCGTLIIQSKFDAVKTLSLIESERITLLPAVPAMYQFMLATIAAMPVKPDLSSVRICFSGAAALPVDLIEKIEETFGAPVVEGYGLTETSCVATINRIDAVRKAGSVGPPVPGVDIAIMDDAGKQLPAGPENVGEIAVGGPHIMLGYYKQFEATAEVMKGDWFLTGDLGYKDSDGYLYIVGRKKEMIIRGGVNIYPREVEEVIARLPGVREVAVIGVPDPNMGERVKALVVKADPSLSEEDIKNHCTQCLADYKVPRIVEFVDHLPRNSTGKVLKRLLS